MKGTLARLAITAATVGVWVAFFAVSAVAISTGYRYARPIWFQIDWRVYAAGAQDLLERSLYREPLHLGGLPLPVPEFNLPPAAALWAVPLAWLPLETGGVAWQIVMAASLAAGSILVARVARLPHPALVAGLVAVPYSLHISYLDGIIGGTNNHLVMALVALFAWAHVERRHRTAGIALALAIATKLWPMAVIPLLLRERRWSTLRWAGAALAVQAVAFLAWLGPGVIDPAREALGVTAPVESTVFGLSALREIFDWWPAWIAPALAVVLVALPVRGRAGIGLGMLAGMALVPNLWLHYIPTVAAAFVLLASDVWSAAAHWLARARERLSAERRSEQRPATSSRPSS